MRDAEMHQFLFLSSSSTWEPAGLPRNQWVTEIYIQGTSVYLGAADCLHLFPIVLDYVRKEHGHLITEGWALAASFALHATILEILGRSIDEGHLRDLEFAVELWTVFFADSYRWAVPKTNFY
mmetsp:Transcript_9677/g.18807  ORF Transcript_9677/g.18807 Transcript_9677/m.18807 type:complete len:123 (+) Transcript_9677:1238-1606(+)